MMSVDEERCISSKKVVFHWRRRLSSKKNVFSVFAWTE